MWGSLTLAPIIYGNAEKDAAQKQKAVAGQWRAASCYESPDNCKDDGEKISALRATVSAT